MSERIGFVGLGQMGQPMALNLLRAGFELRVFDLREEAWLRSSSRVPSLERVQGMPPNQEAFISRSALSHPRCQRNWPGCTGSRRATTWPRLSWDARRWSQRPSFRSSSLDTPTPKRACFHCSRLSGRTSTTWGRTWRSPMSSNWTITSSSRLPSRPWGKRRHWSNNVVRTGRSSCACWLIFAATYAIGMYARRKPTLKTAAHSHSL